MKKILSGLICCLLFGSVFAQIKLDNATMETRVATKLLNGGPVTNVSDTTCFCCSDFYNLPAPEIKGPVKVNCSDKPQFNISPCPGAFINWIVTPANPFTGNGTNSITLTPPLSASGYTITATVNCNRKQSSGSIKISVISLQNCTPDFNITVKQLGNGLLNIDAVPVTAAGAEHWWGIVYNGTYPNCTIPCISIPFADITTTRVWGGVHETAANPTVVSVNGMGTGVTAGSSGYGINYSGFPNNSCFKITHYISCCGVWYKQTQCVSIGTSNLKIGNPTPGSEQILHPTISKTEIEKVDVSELPKRMQ